MAEYRKEIDSSVLLEGERPKMNHLGLWTGPGNFTTAIPPGATLYIIESGKDGARDTAFPLILLNVSKRGMELKCACGQPTCSKKVKFKASWTGNHPEMHKQ